MTMLSLVQAGLNRDTTVKQTRGIDRRNKLDLSCTSRDIIFGE